MYNYKSYSLSDNVWSENTDMGINESVSKRKEIHDYIECICKISFSNTSQYMDFLPMTTIEDTLMILQEQHLITVNIDTIEEVNLINQIENDVFYNKSKDTGRLTLPVHKIEVYFRDKNKAKNFINHYKVKPNERHNDYNDTDN